MAALAADRQRQMIALGVVFADHRARFHEIGHDAGIDDGDFGDRLRFRERRLGRLLVADRHIEQHIAGMIGPDLRCVFLHGIDDADRRGQRRPVDLDRLDRVAGLIDRVGYNESHGVADMARHAVGENRIGRTRERIHFQIEQARKTAEILDIVGGEDGGDTR